jgi:hypothetical protein
MNNAIVKSALFVSGWPVAIFNHSSYLTVPSKGGSPTAVSSTNPALSLYTFSSIRNPRQQIT